MLMIGNKTNIMEVFSLIPSSAVSSQFAHSAINFVKSRRLTANHCCLLNIATPAAPQPPLKVTTLPRKPSYKIQRFPEPISDHNITTSSPEKKGIMNYDIDANRNTSSDVLRLMDALGLVVTPDIYASLVAECTRKQHACQATELFAHMKQNYRMVGFLNRPTGLFLLYRILMMLVVCGCLDVALQLFEEMPQRDCICLAIMTSGFVNYKLFDRALDLFVEMHQCFSYRVSDIAFQVVFVCVLDACVHLQHIGLGKVVHGWLVKNGYCRELFVVTALAQFYARIGCLAEANSLFFEQIQFSDHCDYALWTGAIVNNCRGGCFEEVIRIFVKMGRVGVKTNEYIALSVLKSCGRVKDGESYGKQVHANVVKLGLDVHNLVISGLIDMYGRSGLLNDARKAFDMVDPFNKNSACWKAMVTSFIQNGLCIEAIKLLYLMKAAGLQPQQSLVDKVRVACGSEK